MSRNVLKEVDNFQLHSDDHTGEYFIYDTNTKTSYKEPKIFKEPELFGFLFIALLERLGIQDFIQLEEE